MNTKILLVDDHKILRDGLRSLLESQKNLDVVGEADGGLEAVRLAQKLAPDLIIMDVTMHDLNGIDATRQILKNQPAIKVIALSMRSDRRMVDEMLRAGAAGYVVKESAFKDLTLAIKAVMKGDVYLSSVVTRAVVEEIKQSPSAENNSAFTVLTAREREVLQLMAEGQTTKQIAGKLFISTKTVETHRL